jgi:hypothetical protein
MNPVTVEQRREARRPGRGAVVVRWSNPRPQEVQGKLVDVSDNGFRMAHDCAALTAGQFVEFSHVEARGRARVVWTRILSGAVESGFLVSAD